MGLAEWRPCTGPGMMEMRPSWPTDTTEQHLPSLGFEKKSFIRSQNHFTCTCMQKLHWDIHELKVILTPWNLHFILRDLTL